MDAKKKKILIGGLALALIVVVVVTAKAAKKANTAPSTDANVVNGQITDAAGLVQKGATQICVGGTLYPIGAPIEGGIGTYGNKPKMGG